MINTNNIVRFVSCTQEEYNNYIKKEGKKDEEIENINNKIKEKEINNL